MVDRWALAIQASSPKYAERPIEELRGSAYELIEGTILAAEKNDYSRLLEFIKRITAIRSEMGFNISEVQNAIMLGSTIVLEELAKESVANGAVDPAADFAKVTEIMNWTTLMLTDILQDVMRKEFSASTLVALNAAQEELDQESITRKSLDECTKLLGFEHGAMMMRYLNDFVDEVPRGTDLDLSVMKPVAFEVIANGEPVIRELEPEKPVMALGRKRPAQLRIVVGVPVMARGKILGALLLGSPAQRPVSQHDVSLMTAVASQMGLAYDNARLLKEAKRRADYFKSEYDELFTILSQLGAYVYVSDINTYEVVAVNRAFEDSLGKDLVGKKCYARLQKGRTAPCDFCTNRYLLKDGEPTGPYTWSQRHPDSGKWFKVTDRAIRWPDGRMVRLSAAFDVTEIEEVRSNLERAHSVLELYNDLLVHDITNYVAVAVAYLGLMTKEHGVSEKHNEMGAIALSQLSKIDELTNRISKLARASTSHAPSMSAMDLDEALDGAIAVAVKAVGKDASITKEAEPGRHFVLAGEFVEEVYMNIVSNALKYGEGRPVVVSITESSLKGKPAWRTTVTDQGKGIPPEKRALVFGRFERLESVSGLKGLGLGLALVRALTEAYGGEVEIRDRVEGDYTQGTSVSVTFMKASSDNASS